MGYYISPSSGMPKGEWLERHGEEASLQDTIDPEAFFYECVKDRSLPVCLIDNGLFETAGIGYNADETEEFNREDGRMKTWYIVPARKVLAVCPKVQEALAREFVLEL